MSGARDVQTEFFRTLFGDATGYLHIAKFRDGRPRGARAFAYPAAIDAALDYIDNAAGVDVYFCVGLLVDPAHGATKGNVAAHTRFIHADCDAVDPRGVEPPASIVIETSPGRYHGYWLLRESLAVGEVEAIARRLTYACGFDRGGWFRNKLLRVPATSNFKAAYAESASHG